MQERADDERANRGVHVEHGDDGMSWLSAYLPASQAAAIDERLTREANWPLCRNHHKLKGHGAIMCHLPSGRQKPAERTAHSPPLGDVSWGEHHSAQIVVAELPG